MAIMPVIAAPIIAAAIALIPSADNVVDTLFEFNDEFDLNEYKCIEVDTSLLNELSNGWYVLFMTSMI